MKASVKILILLFLVAVVTGCGEAENNITRAAENEDPLEAFTGGETTIFLASSQAFSTPAPNLSASSLDKHLEGDLNFEQNFVKAPAEVNGGLGPLYNNVSCINCHVSDGRGRPPLAGESLGSMLIRISIDGVGPHGGPNPVPGFGGQLQDQALFGFTPEATFEIVYTEVSGTYPDGTPYSLRKPVYNLSGRIPANVLTSPRVAPSIFGLGLLEAVQEEDILANMDEYNANSDKISGRPNYVWDVVAKKQVLGRFGWKANTPSLIQQTAAAYVNDMGITNPLFEMENCHDGEQCDTLSDDPEIDMDILESVAFYCQTLAVPAKRNRSDIKILEGKTLFNEVGCNGCHTPSFTTGNHELIELSNQKIFPYTDLLLHDLGDELADGRSDFLATGNEWRTAPLWGIGLVSVVNGHTNFLHDGRARNIEEAILWHGGEAEDVIDRFKSLTAGQREKLIKFVNSL